MTAQHRFDVNVHAYEVDAYTNSRCINVATNLSYYIVRKRSQESIISTYREHFMIFLAAFMLMMP